LENIDLGKKGEVEITLKLISWRYYVGTGSGWNRLRIMSTDFAIILPVIHTNKT
jgi:hypothetical protein